MKPVLGPQCGLVGRSTLPRLLLAGAAALLLMSCGGGGGSGGGESEPTQPVISNFFYAPTAEYVNSGGGQVNVNGTLAFSGANGGPASVTIDVVDSGGITVSTSTTHVAGGSGVTSGILQGSVMASTSTVGIYEIRIIMTDLSERVSNTLSGAFRIANHPWVVKAPMPNARSFFAVATSSGLAYVMGGSVSGGGPGGANSPLVETYDPVTNLWALGIPLPTGRSSAVAVAANDVIYVIGGLNSSIVGGIATPTPLATVEAFDTKTMMWSTRASMPTARYGASAAVIDDRICVFGGTDNTTDLATTECFDPLLNNWSTQPPMSTPRDEPGADALGAFAYVVGGKRGIEYLKLVQRFDIASGTWTSLTQMLTARGDASVVSASGLLFAIGGINASQLSGTQSVEAYDPASNSWLGKTAAPTLVGRAGAVTIGGLIYVFEGDTTLQYTPGDDIR